MRCYAHNYTAEAPLRNCRPSWPLTSGLPNPKLNSCRCIQGMPSRKPSNGTRRCEGGWRSGQDAGRRLRSSRRAGRYRDSTNFCERASPLSRRPRRGMHDEEIRGHVDGLGLEDFLVAAGIGERGSVKASKRCQDVYACRVRRKRNAS